MTEMWLDQWSNLTHRELEIQLKASEVELQAATNLMMDPTAETDELLPELYVWDTEHGFLFCCGPPWIHTLYMGALENRRLNAQYRYKSLMFEQAYREEKLAGIFNWCERPYRAELLYEVRDDLDDEDFWSTLGWVWTDSENCYQNLDLFKEMFTCDRPGREALMDADEWEAYEKLPDPVPIWHGVDGSEFAWSTSKKVAEWFAYRFPEKGKIPRLRSGLAPKEHILAHFLGRGEDEVLIDPQNVLDMKEEELPPDRKLRHPGLDKEESAGVS